MKFKHRFQVHRFEKSFIYTRSTPLSHFIFKNVFAILYPQNCKMIQVNGNGIPIKLNLTKRSMTSEYRKNDLN